MRGPLAIYVAAVITAALIAAWVMGLFWNEVKDDAAVSAVAGSLGVEEGFRGLPYDDTRGHATIGYGTKLPITEAEGAWLLETRLADTHDRLAEAWAPYEGLDPARQGALLDMAYELGVEGWAAGLPRRRRCCAALERGDWPLFSAISAASAAARWRIQRVVRRLTRSTEGELPVP